MRKIATQVPAAVSRLLQSSPNQSPPVWYIPILTNPPSQLPPRQSVKRQLPTASDRFTDLPPQHYDASREGRSKTHKIKHFRGNKPKPLPIVYEEDKIRRQFFRDFPFEALRPVSLVEGVEIRQEEVVKGLQWERLDQRGLYPSVEDCIAFTLTLHHDHGQPLSTAYSTSIEQFVKLRATHEMSTIAAEAEARHHGAWFKRDPFERIFDLEERSLNTSATGQVNNLNTNISTKFKRSRIWSSVVPPSALPFDLTEPTALSEGFSGGRRYVERWRLPPPVVVEGSEEASGDLMSLLDNGSSAQQASVDETRVETGDDELMDELDFLNAQLGVSGSEEKWP